MSDKMLLDAAQRLFETEHGPDAWVGPGSGAMEKGAPIWLKIEHMGLPLGLVPESAGGFGADPLEVFETLRAAARVALPCPLAETMIAAALISRAGLDLPEGPASFAAPAPGVVSLTREGDGFRLRGELARVPFARGAAAVAVTAELDGAAHLALVAPGDCTQAAGENVAGEPRDTLTVDALLPASAVAPTALDAARVFALGAAVRAIGLAGALEQTTAMTVQYANDRVQFGRPIGKFQAIQQNLSVAAGQTAAAVAAAGMAAEAAADLLDGGSDLAPIAAAKIRTGEAAGLVATIAQQTHGAIGFTLEHPLRLFTKRLWSWREEFGNEARWSRDLGRTALSAGQSGFWPMISSY
ncbi:MAG: acyl-CoA dehydrogenase family protein [Pseudomonadota bacterium]|nr:acyl-CoA dehydrogenase family protein [Pseudomonadota bacterium]